MIDRDHIRRMSDAQALDFPEADLDDLAAQLAAQLEQVRAFDRLDLRDLQPGTCFDVRWDR